MSSRHAPLVVLSLLLIALISLFLISCGGPKEEPIGFEFTLNKSGTAYSITNSNFPVGAHTIIVPAEYNGLPVTEVDCISSGGSTDATVACGPYDLIFSEGIQSINYIGGNVTSLTLPSTIQKIGGKFTDTPIRSVTFADGTKSIPENAFDGFLSLENVFIPESVTLIGKDAFRGCPSLTSVIVPRGVTTIGAGAFYGCRALTSLSIPESVTEIGPGAFCGSGCRTITVDEKNQVYHSAGNCIIETGSRTLICGNKYSIIPSDGSVTSLADFAFSGCADLVRISLPDCLVRIGQSAFSDCTALADIALPNSLMGIGAYAFRHCSALTTLALPDSITEIKDSTFENCTALQSISLPKDLTAIGGYAFAYCTSLLSISLPEGVTLIA